MPFPEQRGFPDAPEARSSGIWGGFPTISARSARDPMMSSTAGAVLGGARPNGGGERRATRTLLINASCHKLLVKGGSCVPSHVRGGDSVRHA